MSEELVEKILGSGVSVSPVLTIEPRHRKFHQPISITIPLPPKSSLRGGKTRPAAGAPTLRLLCSMTGQSRCTAVDIFILITHVTRNHSLVL